LGATIESIKVLRNQTGAGIMDCKRALVQSEGDLERAQVILSEQGIASAARKVSRTADDGLVEGYVHKGNRIGSMVEVNCETDFVARTSDFKTLAHNIAMQVAAMAPLYVDTDDIPDGEDMSPQEVCLMQQPFIKDPDLTVQDLVNQAIGKLGENVRVRRFARFSLGE